MQEYKAMWKNYANFNDLTSVRGYWMAAFFNFVVSVLIALVAKIIPILSFLGGLYSIAALVPGLAITIRRLRDSNRDWKCIFVALIPVVGPILLIIWLCQPTANWQGKQV